MKHLFLTGVLTLVTSTAFAHDDDDDDDDPSNVKLALDLDVTFPHDEGGADSGYGAMARIGYELDAILITLTPELGLGYIGFGGVNSAAVYRGMGGARLKVGKVLQPGIFAHIGGGHLSASPTPDQTDASRTGLAYDGGVSLDLTLLPVIDLGAHASYNRLVGAAAQSDFAWFAVGLHVAIAL